MKKPKILVVQDWFLPAYKGGGSLRTVVNIVQRLGADFDFDVLCRDRDQDDTEPFPEMRPGWVQRYGCRVLYLPPERIHPRGLRAAAAGSDYGLLYFNSFFSKFTVYLLLLRRFGLLPRRPVLLAPRGELAANPLAIKRFKKNAYLRIARWAGLYRGVVWHASSDAERDEIRARFDGPVEVAADLPAPPPEPATLPDPPHKRPGELRVVFLSRIARKKNLPRAIDLVGRLRGNVTFDIYGTAEDPELMRECEARIAGLPAGVKCRYRGPIPYEQVHATLARYHLFLFPTLNENFGHVILEALVAGLPVLLSDTTYWRGMERRGAGWDLPLDDEDGFLNALQRCVAMDEPRFREMSAAARRVALEYLEDPAPADDTRAMFFRLLGETP